MVQRSSASRLDESRLLADTATILDHMFGLACVLFKIKEPESARAVTRSHALFRIR